MDYQHVVHPFEPVYDENSEILILGTFPSVRSRQTEFYYGHPQNRFWRVLARLTGEEVPQSIAEKRSLLLRHGIALWDVLGSCDIRGSSDSSICNAEPTDIRRILEAADIRAIYANGGTAARLYRKYQQPNWAFPSFRCPPPAPPTPAGHWIGSAPSGWSSDSSGSSSRSAGSQLTLPSSSGRSQRSACASFRRICPLTIRQRKQSMDRWKSG